MIDIGTSSDTSGLSNFTPRRFYISIKDTQKVLGVKIDTSKYIDKLIDGKIVCNSIEGALQALKIESPILFLNCCAMVGIKAKRYGSKRNNDWKPIQTLWFLGIPVKRDTAKYTKLLEFIFKSCFDHEKSKFKKDLLAVKGEILVHSVSGDKKKVDTVLTEKEFITILYELINGIGTV